MRISGLRLRERLFGGFLGGLKKWGGFHGRKLVAKLLDLPLGGIKTALGLLQVFSHIPEFILESGQLAAQAGQVTEDLPGTLLHFQTPEPQKNVG